MAREAAVQREIIGFFVKSESKGGLGYREFNASQVNKRTLIINQDFEAWFSSGRNAKPWNQLLKSLNQDSEKAINMIIDAITSRVKQYSNAAIFFQNNKTLSVDGYTFFTYEQSSSDNSDYLGEIQDDPNRYAIVEEFTYERDGRVKRPDLCFFMNGIYIGYLELKTTSSSGIARKEGVEKIIGDFLEFARTLPGFNKNEMKPQIRDNLQLWNQAIVVGSFDMMDFYVTRLPVEFHLTNALKTIKKENGAESKYFEEFKSSFFTYPSDINDQLGESWQGLLKSHYGKSAIQNEIMFFNFIENSGRKESAKAISPRPKQKFGVDKTMRRICHLLKHENNPTFFMDEVLSHPRLSNATEEEIEVAKSSLYKSEKINSILLQYSAGFGKTNIICWLALRIKNLMIHGHSAYEKIFLVADRLDLKDQIDAKMANMNIERSLFSEVSNKNDMKKALCDDSRIVIINIQKFRTVSELEPVLSQIDNQDSRYAFIIDEVHRSQNGKQHDNMMDIFFKEGKVKRSVKNLVIGLTATPSDDVLQRFGEVHSPLPPCKYAPFDSFTMKEAIEAGFVHNPISKTLKLDIKMRFDPERTLSKEDKIDFNYVRDVYENEERINIIAEKTTDLMFKHTFKRIQTANERMGKAMFACKSTRAANRYYKAFKRAFENYREKYPNEPDVKIYVVFTSSGQGEEKMTDIVSAEELMGYRSEKETIKEFKKQNRALIIVVQKLQTGFDDPKLHTLFLDRPVSDIEGVQTACRINRTMKGKKDCLIVDCTFEHDNIEALKVAFEKYEGVVIREGQDTSDLRRRYVNCMKTINNAPLSKKFREKYQSIFDEKSDKETKHQKYDQLHRMMVNDIEKAREENVSIDDLKKAVSDLFKIKDEHYHIANLPKEYTEVRLIAFYSLVKSALKVVRDRSVGNVKVNIHIDPEDCGILLNELYEQELLDESKGKKKRRPSVNNEAPEDSLINRLLELNFMEDEKSEQRAWYQDQVNTLIDKISSERKDLVAGLKDGKLYPGLSAYEDAFSKGFGKVRRYSAIKNPDLYKFSEEMNKAGLIEMLSSIFAERLLSKE